MSRNPACSRTLQEEGGQGRLQERFLLLRLWVKGQEKTIQLLLYYNTVYSVLLVS